MKCRHLLIHFKTTISPPVYSKPRKYKDWEVPDIYLSGDQKNIEDWRNKKAIELTNKKRPKL